MLLARPNIHHSQTWLALFPVRQLARGDLHFQIRFMAIADMRYHFVRVQAAVSCAECFQGFLWLKTATAASADVIPPKQSSLCAGEFSEDFAHGGGVSHCGYDGKRRRDAALQDLAD